MRLGRSVVARRRQADRGATIHAVSEAACNFGVSDYCDDISDTPCGSTSWGGIPGVTIPPNGKILIYSAPYATTGTGAFKVVARLTALNAASLAHLRERETQTLIGRDAATDGESI